MEDDILQKLRAELERGISTEPQIVYLMVKIRKLLDLDKPHSAAYSTLRLYCDWCVHIKLCGPRAQEIVMKMDALYPDMLGGTLSMEGKHYLRDIFAFNKFHDELNQFLYHKCLPTLSESQWHLFLTGFLNTVEDCSLKVNGMKLTNIDEVLIFKEGRKLPKVPGDSAPPFLWALCYEGKLRFPMSGNTPLSDDVVQALIAFGKRREQTAESS